jgi:hypothetical protein
MKKKYGIEFTENKNGRLVKYTIYADSVKEAMDFIELSKKNKKTAIKITDNDNKLIHKEEHHDDDDYMYA